MFCASLLSRVPPTVSSAHRSGQRRTASYREGETRTIIVGSATKRMLTKLYLRVGLNEGVMLVPTRSVGGVDLIQIETDYSHARAGLDGTGPATRQVDGVTVNNAYDNKASLRLDRSLLEEVQVISGTFDAEYGQAMSGVVNAVLKKMIANGLHPCVLASRILGGYSLQGGMPGWKYVANRFLTAAENFLLGAKLSEYHTGYRAFSKALLQKLEPNLAVNSPSARSAATSALTPLPPTTWL